MLTASEVKALARQAGFDLCGITTAEPFVQAEARLLDFLARGYFAELPWITAERIRQSCDPTTLLPGARSVVAVALNTLSAGKEPADDQPRGRVSRAYRGDGYRVALRERLERFVALLRAATGDSAGFLPLAGGDVLLDRAAAERAGLGWVGKNTMVLTLAFGTWVVLGEVITTLPLEPDRPLRLSCGTCRRCVDACPTGAIVAPFQLDATRCIARFTQEPAEPIPRALRAPMGDRFFGCDICQEVCPWSQRARPAPAPLDRPADDPLGERPALIPLLALDEAAFAARFGATPAASTGRAGILRNAAVALGNSGDRRAVPALLHALTDESALVRGHAAWALARLGGEEVVEALRRRLAVEDDPAVREEIRWALGEGAGEA